MTAACDARHDGHDCTRPGACRAALLAMCQRISARNTQRREREGSRA